MIRRNLFDAFFSIVVISIVGGTLYISQGCVGAPKSKQQLVEMSEEDFQEWLTRVALWTELASMQVVRKHPDSADKLTLYAGLVEGLAGDPDPLGLAAKTAEFDEPLIQLLVMEGRALLESRGGMPTGDRAIELLRTVAAGVRAGIDHAAQRKMVEKL